MQSRFVVIFLLLAVCTPSVFADPPADPPPCIGTDPVFCFRITDISKLPGEERFQFEFLVVNWTGADAHGLILSLNTAREPGGGLTMDSPRFSGAAIDANGRPIGPGAFPPTGNAPTSNTWIVNEQTETQIRFGVSAPGLDPIGHPAVLGFNGLLDPLFDFAPPVDCIVAQALMIPGTVLDNTLPFIFIPEPETIDDGTNVLDGFIVEIDNWDEDEELSFNWHFTDASGDNIGIFSMGPLGDQYGFGSFNMVRFTDTPPTALFDQNSGYDPDTNDPDVDSPRFWGEDEVAGIDTFPINPIPAGKEGEGIYFAVEPGAAVTAPFSNPQNNQFFFGGGPIQSGTNLEAMPLPGYIRGDCNGDGVFAGLTDALTLLTFAFVPGGAEPGCPPGCNASGGGTFLSNAIYMLNAAFLGGPPPPAPFPDCGSDGTGASCGICP